MKIRHCLNILTILAAIIVSSCSKNTIDDYPMGMQPKSGTPTGITLGNRLENAYTLSNMTAAWHSLFGINVRCPLVATHYYVKILPQDSTDVTRLVEDTSLCLFPYPLDYELIGEGMYELDSTDTAWVYTVVPVGYNLSGLTYTVIDTCCIPNDGDTLLERVEERSLKLTGNIPQNQPRVSGRPSGLFRVYNNTSRSYDGVRRVKVVLRTLVRVRQVDTENDGSYSCGTKFFTNVAYSINYTNTAGFILWHNWGPLSPATFYMGVHSPTGYSYDMWTTSGGWFLSTVNNAANIYYKQYCPTLGVTTPPTDLRILVCDINKRSGAPMFHHCLYPSSSMDSLAFFLLPPNYSFYLNKLHKLSPDIFILKNTDTTYDIYSVVFHELSHASHYKRVGNSYWMHVIMGEASNWFNGDVYGDGNGVFDGYIGIAEMWACFSNYTISKYIWNGIHETKMQCRKKWFRPGLLDTLSSNVPIMTTGYICQSLTDNENTMCNFKQKLVFRTPFEYKPTTNSTLNPVCNITY